MKIKCARHLYPENVPFSLLREKGLEEEYVFVHFLSPVRMQLGEDMISVFPSTCILYNTNTPQLWYCDVPLIHDWIHITGNVKEAIVKYGLEFDKLYPLQNSFFVTNITNEIEHEFFCRYQFSEEICDLKLNELFAKIARGKTPTFPEEQTKKIFETVRFYVFSNLNKPWKVSDMAKLTNFSEARFFVLYKNIFGITPTQDIIFARIESAKRMLSQKKYSITEIAELTGYSSEHHFIRQFKEHVGISPGKFTM